jgi:hypothetical protein
MAEAAVAHGQLPAEPGAAVESGASERVPRRIIRPPLWLFATLAVFLLLVGAARVISAPKTDAAEYQCYALAFWAGYKPPIGDPATGGFTARRPPAENSTMERRPHRLRARPLRKDAQACPPNWREGFSSSAPTRRSP